ncbi:MAG: hypothetical protein N5P05_002375 [Chroococcopsis gigantea SAG 12.99]|nr:hypothetical protein [Chroococcopsis gigantea SAG 12.99]
MAHRSDTVKIPIPSQVWKGQAQNSGWRELKEIIKAERGAKFLNVDVQKILICTT